MSLVVRGLRLGMLLLAPIRAPHVLAKPAANRHRLLCRFHGDRERLFHLDQLTRIHLANGWRVAHLIEGILELFLDVVKLGTQRNSWIDRHSASSLKGAEAGDRLAGSDGGAAVQLASV